MGSRYKLASFFAGVGGIELGFAQAGNIDTVYANEFDRRATATYEANFPIQVDCRDICTVEPSDFPDIDIITGGFPCQAFSVAGRQQGFADAKGRGLLFFELLRLIRAKQPRVVFFENVKNLVGHDYGNTFRIILEALRQEGYLYRYQILNAMDYGNIPQNRERIYIVGFKHEADFAKFSFPDPIPLTCLLNDVIDFVSPQDPKYYYTDGKYKGEIMTTLRQVMTDTNAIYQWRRKYVRKNMSGVVPTLTANMGEGGHNVPLILTELGIRKLTPHECFNVQGFPTTYQLPRQADSHLYKQAGNSVCVSVIRRIAENIVKALDSNN